MPQKIQKFKDYLIKLIKVWYGNQITLPPTMYFLSCFLLKYIFEFDGIRAVHLLSVLLALIVNFNFVYFLPINSSGLHPYQIIQVLSLIISCNRKHKFLLYLFVEITSFQNIHDSDAVTALAALFMVLAIYKSLIFDTIKENTEYFSGFFTIFMIFASKAFAEYLNFKLQLVLLLIIAACSYSLSQNFIQIKISKTEDQELLKQRDPHIKALQIAQMTQRLKDPMLAEVEIKMALKNSQHQSRMDTIEDKARMLLDELFQSSFESTKLTPNEQLLSQSYIDHLLSNHQAIKALNFISNWYPQSYFIWAARLRCEYKVTSFLSEVQNFTAREVQYEMALNYDKLSLKFQQQLIDVINLKIAFWKESAQKEPRLNQMQKLGVQAVDKMYVLNNFYGETIRPYEQGLGIIDATSVYATFLLAGTCFEEYAKQIRNKTIRNIDKNMELPSETFAIKTSLLNLSMGYTEKWYEQFESHQETLKDQRSNSQQSFRLVIDNMSQGLSGLLGNQNQFFIGKQLNSIIPQAYQRRHRQKINQVLSRINPEVQKQHRKVLTFHEQAQLPLKSNNSELLFKKVSVKVQTDLTNGPCFISIIQDKKDKSVSALTTLDGKLMAKQKDFPAEILDHYETQQYYELIKTRWISDNILKQQNYDICISSVYYHIIINSPLSKYSLEQFLENTPPIHISAIRTKMTKERKDEPNQSRLTDQRRQIAENQLNDQQSTISVKTSNELVYTLSTYVENGSLPIYKWILVVFIVSILICLGLHVASYKYNSFQWDPTISKGNPVGDFSNLYDIYISSLRSLLNYKDAQAYYHYAPLMNLTHIDSYQGNVPFDKYMATVFQEIKVESSQAIEAILSNSSIMMNNFIQTIFEKKFLLNNTDTKTIINPALVKSTIPMTYREILLNQIVDYYYIQKHINSVGNLFSQKVNGLISSIIVPSDFVGLQKNIAESINQSSKNQIIFGALSSVSLLILIIPLFCFLKKRYEPHTRIFDTISSINGKDIMEEVKTLLSVAHILNNQQKYRSIINSQMKNNNDEINVESIIEQDPLINTLNQNETTQNQKKGKSAFYPNQESQNNEETPLLRGNKDQNIFSSIKAQLSTERLNKNQISERKMAGNLDTRGSQYQLSTRIDIKHFILYLSIVLCALLLTSGLILIKDQKQKITNTKNLISKIYDDILYADLKLIFPKFLFTNTSDSYFFYYQITGRLSQFYTDIKNMTTYNQYQDYSTAFLSPCQGSQKLCQYTSTLRIMEGQLISITKMLVDQRIQNHINRNSTPSSLAQSYERIIYLQSVNNKVYKMKKNILNLVYREMLDFAIEKKNNKEIIFIIALFLIFLSLMTGLLIISRMKRQYQKQVYMLSFLNKKMIINNKRIQSFLEALLKNK